jgi:hypothetical protein
MIPRRTKSYEVSDPEEQDPAGYQVSDPAEQSSVGYHTPGNNFKYEHFREFETEFKK